MFFELFFKVIAMLVGGVFLISIWEYINKGWSPQRKLLKQIILGFFAVFLNFVVLLIDDSTTFYIIITGGYIFTTAFLLASYPPLIIGILIKNNKELFSNLIVKDFELFGIDYNLMSSIREAKELSCMVNSNLFLHIRGKKLEITPKTDVYELSSGFAEDFLL